jgi:hypothetical protein|tara:strand:- start:2097 stop:2540 length:444 start_codon:yes stop_codon:yes gene_type:complete
MKNKTDNTQKCEFVLTLGKNIVCQRFFSVRNFNNNSAFSLDLHETMSDIINDMKDRLKQKTLFLLDSNFRENPNQQLIDEGDFTITIKKGNKSIYSRILPADVYPPKVRYTVDIRPQISNILRELTEVLSSRKVTTYYQDYSLMVSE